MSSDFASRSNRASVSSLLRSLVARPKRRRLPAKKIALGAPERLENRDLMATLQILHASDLEGGVEAIKDAPNFAAVVQALENQAAGNYDSILLSAGDNYLPGPFFSAAGDAAMVNPLQKAYEDLFGLPANSLGSADATGTLTADNGRVDVTIMNILGFDASALGNHEFDLGTRQLRDIIAGANAGGTNVGWFGAQFPYLSANLDFSADSNLSSLFTTDILDSATFDTPADPGNPGQRSFSGQKKIAPSTLITVAIDTDGNGTLDGTAQVGVVGATTPLLNSISSPGATAVKNPGAGTDDMAALASILNPEIADLKAAGADLIILVSHLQQFSLEQTLVPLLNDVDVVIAGGSDTRLANPTPELPLREGDVADGAYPYQTTNLNGETTFIVSTDGEYSYVGRLVIDFDPLTGTISGLTTGVTSGAYATDDAGVQRLWGNLTDPFATGTKGQQVKSLVDSVRTVVTTKDSNQIGQTDFFLDGRRASVRTEETNLGNLSSDANLWAANQFAFANGQAPVDVAISNGGGIRAEIGQVDPETGELLAPQDNPESGKLEGNISQLDVENSLRFNNALSIVTVTVDELRLILEHAVAATAPGATPGQFAQIGGLAFSYDATRTATTFNNDGTVNVAGSRVRSIALLNTDGTIKEVLMRDGVVLAAPTRTLRVVAPTFLVNAASGTPGLGGDRYPFPAFGSDRVDTPLTQQSALTSFLQTYYPAGSVGFAKAETTQEFDERIQNLAVRADSLAVPSLQLDLLDTIVSPNAEFDEGSAEIVAYDAKTHRIFYTNANSNTLTVVDASDPRDLQIVGEIDLTPYGATAVNSVAVSKNGIVAVAIERGATGTDPGAVVFFDSAANFAAAVTPLNVLTVGAQPDSLTFTPDGRKLLVAIEGEDTIRNVADLPGGVSIVDLGYGTVSSVRRLTQSRVKFAGFTAFDSQIAALRNEGVRIFPIDVNNPAAGYRLPSVDFEPEYIAVSADGRTARVTLQEANAVAVLDLRTGRFTDVQALGLKDHSLPGNGIDPSDRDGAGNTAKINIHTVPVFGMYMPDTIATYTVGGQTYYVTANEGDDRNDGAGPDDAVRVGSGVGGLNLDDAVFPNEAALKTNAELARLNVSAFDGDTDGDGDVDRLLSFGTRSFSIWDSAGNLVFDSGDDFEQITAALFPSNFNASNTSNALDDRSDNKGPEPEAVTIGSFAGRTYAFVGLERVGGVMIYDVTNPNAVTFVEYVNNRDFNVSPALGAGGDLGPESIVFVSPSDSGTGEALLIVANEVSGSVSVYRLSSPTRAGEGITVAGPTGSGPVQVFNADGSVRFSLFPFGESYKGGVRVATADVNGDGTPDVIATPTRSSSKVAAEVVVIDGATGAEYGRLGLPQFAFGELYVSAGDLDADGFAELLVGGVDAISERPTVVVFDGQTGLESARLVVPGSYADGVSVAVADVVGDDALDVVVGEGTGGAGFVTVFDGGEFATEGTFAFAGSFATYGRGFRGGVSVAAGDVDADGQGEIVVSAESANRPVLVLNAATGAIERQLPAPRRGRGASVAVGDVNNDGTDDVLIANRGASPVVQAIDGLTGAPVDTFRAFDPRSKGYAGIAARRSASSGVTVSAMLSALDALLGDEDAIAKLFS